MEAIIEDWLKFLKTDETLSKVKLTIEKAF